MEQPLRRRHSCAADGAADAPAAGACSAAAPGALLRRHSRSLPCLPHPPACLPAAVVELYNGLVDMEDPSELTAADVKSVGDHFGINMQRDQLDGLKKIYSQFLENMIPTGGCLVLCLGLGLGLGFLLGAGDCRGWCWP
jgi:hypothetical protein